MTNRLALYVIHDKDGVIDDYIPYFLEALSPFVSRIIIVCKGPLVNEGHKKLQRFTDDVFVRGAFLHFCAWDTVYAYDELLICNDAFYGPLFPLSECFEKMDCLDVDFWGMTELGLTESMPRHLDPYFLNIKTRLLKSADFYELWEQLPLDYEAAFTSRFSGQGYTYAAYVDARELFREEPEGNYDYSIYDPVDMIRRYRCPLLKRESLSNEGDNLQYLGNENKNLLMKIIDQFTDYDSNMIWDNLLRVCDISDIKNTLHLHYVLSTDTIGLTKCSLANKNTVIILHLYYFDLLEECLSYVDHIPVTIDIVVTTSNPELASKVRECFDRAGRQNAQVRFIRNHGRDIAALLVSCHDILMKYEYLCFTHDKKTRYKAMGQRAADSFRYLLWENTLGSLGYISSVLDVFEENPRLGFLAVPQPFHSEFFGMVGGEWGTNYKNVKALARRLGLHCNLSESKPTFALGSAFWCRTTALKALFAYQWSDEDFPPEPMPLNDTISHAIERIFPYVAQHEGYYSGVMMSDRYAGVRTVDYERLITKILNYVRRNVHVTDYQQFFDDALFSKSELYAFCDKVPYVYIYGVGQIADEIGSLLEVQGIYYQGFIVSDGQPKPDSFRSHPVYFLSELSSDEDKAGVILGLNRKNRIEVLPLLIEHGTKNIFVIN